MRPACCWRTWLRTIIVDSKNQALKGHAAYKVSFNTAVVRSAGVFRAAVWLHTAALIVAHNYPSSDVSPSGEGAQVTRQLVEAGKLLDIGVLDLPIISNRGVLSFKERGLGF